MNELKLQHIGRDDWDRPVYSCDGKLYVDVNPVKSHAPELCTKQHNAFNGEPNAPIDPTMTIEFVPCRDTWR